MIPVSIVIITKNEAGVISRCINSAKLISDDVVIVDSGSTDDTLDIAATCGCHIIERPWDGYGANKNKGIEMAKYDWILSLDADEVPDEGLIKSLHTLKLDKPETVYDIKFRSYFGNKPVHFGSWGRDHHIRLFNRKLVRWSETMVHETLVLNPDIQVKKINTGHIHHYSVKDLNEHESKSNYYAKLSAKKYFNSGKRVSSIKLYISPVFGFFKNYILYLGFLDGRAGWDIAKTSVKNTRLKYQLLSHLGNMQHKKQAVEDRFVMEY